MYNLKPHIRLLIYGKIAYFLFGNLTGFAHDLMHYFETRTASIIITSSQCYVIMSQNHR